MVLRGTRLGGIRSTCEQLPGGRSDDEGKGESLHGRNQDRVAGIGPRRAGRGLRQDPSDGLRRGHRAGPAGPAGGVRPASRERPAPGLGQERHRRIPMAGRSGLHRRRRRLQLGQRHHRGPAGQRAAGAAGQLVWHRPVPWRLLLSAGQRRLRRRRHLDRGLAETPWARAGCRAERDLAQRGGVLPVLPPGVPATRRGRRRGGNRLPDTSRSDRQPSTTYGEIEPDALVYMGYGMLAAKGLLRDRWTSSAGTLRGS